MGSLWDPKVFWENLRGTQRAKGSSGDSEGAPRVLREHIEGSEGVLRILIGLFLFCFVKTRSSRWKGRIPHQVHLFSSESVRNVRSQLFLALQLWYVFHTVLLRLLLTEVTQTICSVLSVQASVHVARAIQILPICPNWAASSHNYTDMAVLIRY